MDELRSAADCIVDVLLDLLDCAFVDQGAVRAGLSKSVLCPVLWEARNDLRVSFESVADPERGDLLC